MSASPCCVSDADLASVFGADELSRSEPEVSLPADLHPFSSDHFDSILGNMLSSNDFAAFIEEIPELRAAVISGEGTLSQGPPQQQDSTRLVKRTNITVPKQKRRRAINVNKDLLVCKVCGVTETPKWRCGESCFVHLPPSLLELRPPALISQE